MSDNFIKFFLIISIMLLIERQTLAKNIETGSLATTMFNLKEEKSTRKYPCLFPEL